MNPKEENPTSFSQSAVTIDLSNLPDAYYITPMHLNASKPFTTREGVASTAPCYESQSATNNTITLGGQALSDSGASVFIPGAPRATGMPFHSWWLRSANGTDIDTSRLPQTIYRLVQVISHTEHRLVPTSVTPVLTSKAFSELPEAVRARTWIQAQDSVVLASHI